MKKISLIALSLIASASFAQKVKIKGSDTVLPLAQKEAEVYMKKNAGSAITVIGGGSGVGIAALIDGTTDVAMASRSLKTEEKLKLQEGGKTFKTDIIAYDALAVIVNPTNKVAKLTKEQLDGIFTGKIKNWKEVGGDDMKITVYSRESSSGTFEFFKEQVMGKKDYASTALMLPATGAIVQSVSQTKGAIGYVGLAYLNKSTKAIKVSYDAGKTFVAPSVAAAKNKTYPISRPLFFFYSSKIEKEIKPLVSFILSAAGQKIVDEVGYVSVK
jgi:phosphate transport system substrate-binding protein